MAESLEDRLRSHAKAFDGLLSLIPAKYYYGEDTSDQWQRKKQTKEEARQAQLAKLDPDTAKSAKDVLDERARKRKRELEEDLDLDGLEMEQPRDGLKRPKTDRKKASSNGEVGHGGSKEKDQGMDGKADSTGATADAPRRAKQEKKKAKQERNKAKQGLRIEKRERLQKRREEEREGVIVESQSGPEMDEVDSTIEAPELAHKGEMETSLVKGGGEMHKQVSEESASPSLAPESPNFDVSAGQSGASSTSSIDAAAPKTRTGRVEKPRKIPVDSAELRARLQARIEALRAARKADGLDGKPARNRAELLEARRRKEMERKAHKKELRLKEKEEERQATERALAMRSPPHIGSPLRTPTLDSGNNFSFGRVSFKDGQQVDAGLSHLLDPHKTKGPQDPLGALKAAEHKQSRLQNLNESSRQDIEEKDMWLNARKRAQGDKVRDNTSLLKKTLKRREKAKKRSEGQWTERLEGVEKAKNAKQKRREDNLRKRKEETGGKKGKKVKKVQRRPGFEGSFRAKTGPKKN
ncbi:MAG: surfeit locus protein [Piccolia ochrophora]|nr:MAG: surfeit locus protein [Piccolia ochrophora]